MVEVITWNDFGESHYLGPIKGSQPNSQAWVNGFDHTAWLDLTSYFATAYKTGSYPTVSQDKVYLWARPHPKDANAPDPVGKPANFDIVCSSIDLNLKYLLIENLVARGCPFRCCSRIGSFSSHGLYIVVQLQDHECPCRSHATFPPSLRWGHDERYAQP